MKSTPLVTPDGTPFPPRPTDCEYCGDEPKPFAWEPTEPGEHWLCGWSHNHAADCHVMQTMVYLD